MQDRSLYLNIILSRLVFCNKIQSLGVGDALGTSLVPELWPRSHLHVLMEPQVGSFDDRMRIDQVLGVVQETDYEVVELLLRSQVGVPLVQLLFVDVLDPCPDRLLGVELARVGWLEEYLKMLRHLGHIVSSLMGSVVVQYEDRTS